jgi:hypothetical protein
VILHSTTQAFGIKEEKVRLSEIDFEILSGSDDNENQPPTAIIESISPYRSEKDEYVTFIGRGIDEDGEANIYYWESDVDGFLSSARSFTTPDLSVGTHMITFKVQDDSGEWSKPIHANIVVEEAKGQGIFSITAENLVLWIVIAVISIVIFVFLFTFLVRKKQSKEKEQVHFGFYKHGQN